MRAGYLTVKGGLDGDATATSVAGGTSWEMMKRAAQTLTSLMGFNVYWEGAS